MHWLLLGDFLSTWGYSQVLALLNLHLLRQGFSLGTIGAANSACFLAGSLLAVPAGLISDLYGYRTGLTISFMTLGVAVWLKLQAYNALLLYTAFGLVGAATALSGAAKTPALSSLTPAGRLAPTLALCRSLASVAAVGGSLAAAVLSTQAGGELIALWVGAGITSLAFLPLLALPGDRRRVRILLFSRRSPGRLQSSSLLPFLFFCVANACIFPFINITLAERGMSAGGIGGSLAAFQALAVLVWPLTHWLGHRVVLGLRMSLSGLLLSCLWLASIGPLPIWWVGWLGWHIWLGVAYSYFFAGFGSTGGNQGSFFGVLGLLQMAAAALGSWLGGQLAEIATDWIYAGAGLLLLLSLASLMAQRIQAHR